MPYPSEGREMLSFRNCSGGGGGRKAFFLCVFRELMWSVLGRRCLATGEVGTLSEQPSEGPVLEAEVSAYETGPCPAFKSSAEDRRAPRT